MGAWDEFFERHGEDRSDFIETVETEKPETCAYCDCEDNLVRRKFQVFGKPKSEVICKNCLEEELAYENEESAPVVPSKMTTSPFTPTGTRITKKCMVVGSVLSA